MRGFELTADYVRLILNYNPETGVLIWCSRPREHFKTQREYSAWNARFCGKIAGSLCANGYIYISIDNRKYLAHRVIWLMVKGRWPAEKIDHRDTERSNNCLPNLREATEAQNQHNRCARKTSSSGLKGATWCKRKEKWKAQIRANGCNIHLGYFDEKDDAPAAYVASAKKYFGEFARAA